MIRSKAPITLRTVKRPYVMALSWLFPPSNHQTASLGTFKTSTFGGGRNYPHHAYLYLFSEGKLDEIRDVDEDEFMEGYFQDMHRHWV